MSQVPELLEHLRNIDNAIKSEYEKKFQDQLTELMQVRSDLEAQQTMNLKRECSLEILRKENRELSVRNTQLQEQHDEDVRIHNKQLEMIKQGLLANKEKNDQEHEELLNLTKIPKIYSIGSSRKRSFFKYFLDFTKNNKSKSEDDDDEEEEDEEEEEPPRKIQNINDEETTPEQSSEMPLSDSETVSEPSTVEPSKDETIPLPVKIVSVNNQVEELDNTQNSQADQCSVKSTDIISNDVAQLINQILEAPRVSFYKENLDDEYFMDIDFSEMSSSKMPVKSSEISTKANKALDGLREDPLKTILKSIETGMTSKPNEMIDTAVVKENLCDSNMEDVSEETSAKYPAITHTSSDFLKMPTLVVPIQSEAKTSEEPLPDICESCGFKLFSATDVYVHKGIHIHRCLRVDCGKSFRLALDLKHHDEADHQGVRQFRCNLCSRMYKTSTGLNNHIIDHQLNLRFSLKKDITTLDDPSNTL